MSDPQVSALRIDPEFKKLVPPLPPIERRIMEDRCHSDTRRGSISVWGAFVLVDYELFGLCQREQIPFDTVRVPLKNREEAVAWICANQLKRKDLTEEMRRYLIGKRDTMERILGAHIAAGIKQLNKQSSILVGEPKYEDTASRTREKLGLEYHISYGTVRKYCLYAQMIDAVSVTAPQLATSILSGKVKISHEHLIVLSQMPEKELQEMSAYLLMEGNKVGYSKFRDMLGLGAGSGYGIGSPPKGSIKEMPVYDPDAELSSLTLTIPSWISSVNRVRSVSDISKTSYTARGKLSEALIHLKCTIDVMLAAIKEK